MAIVDLNRQQSFALIAEMTSARNLLAYGVRVMRTGAFMETTRDPILTMLSIGVEKLYKLTLGVVELDVSRKWPDKKAMKARGHGLVRMHHDVMAELRARTVDKSRYVQECVAGVDADPIVEPLINVLDLYGRMGRFYYLDALGDNPQSSNPQDAWEQVEQATFADPTVAPVYARAMSEVGNNEVWNRFHQTFRGRIADAVEGLWVAISVCGSNHALGKTGDTFGCEIHPDMVGRQ